MRHGIRGDKLRQGACEGILRLSGGKSQQSAKTLLRVLRATKGERGDNEINARLGSHGYVARAQFVYRRGTSSSEVTLLLSKDPGLSIQGPKQIT